ncbi:MAG TPA: YjiH family protein [Candidatus Ignatzschineria merdigallinarum]|uniref:YjiH family protein n=1 Tax=Candidatus Ignatzschineria merdigallinarum TaxID=2838621 RepID=A0A9D1Q433_9GAMM|nr:YjiH family protein [Candidatus Ignatzschineria merdigallinarum]
MKSSNSVLSEQGSSARKKFIIYSLIGVLLFITPLPWNGEWSVGVGILATILRSFLPDNTLQVFALSVVVSSAILTLYSIFAKPKILNQQPKLKELFAPNSMWVILRVIGAIFIVMIFFQVGPEWVINKNTGGTILNSLNPTLVPFFLFAIVLLPFLVEYGLMEFVGTLLSKPFNKLFKLPGRSAVDAAASWLGSTPVGVIITAQQYEQGYYTEREAASISTNFAVSSIAFSLLIVSVLGIPQYFIPFYAVVVFTSVIIAVILPRIPPLSLKKETYLTGKPPVTEEAPSDISSYHWAMDRALTKASSAPSIKTALKNSSMVLVDVYWGLMPVVFAIGTIALALSEYTQIFNYLSMPFYYLLEWMNVPDAKDAAPTLLVGFADIFLPAVLGASVESEMTRFIIACTSVIQVIYMTEVGALVLKSKIKLNILELFTLFILRTLIGLPIIVLCAKFIVF